NALDLADDQTGGVMRHEAGEWSELVANSRWCREESIDRDECSDGREHRQKDEEDHAARNGQEPVRVYRSVSAPEDIAPTAPGNSPRPIGTPPPAPLLRPRNIDRSRQRFLVHRCLGKGASRRRVQPMRGTERQNAGPQ